MTHEIPSVSLELHQGYDAEAEQKLLGRVVVLDHPGQARDALVAALTQYAYMVEVYGNIYELSKGLDASGTPVESAIMAYSLLTRKENREESAANLVTRRYPGAQKVITTMIPALISKTAEVQAADAIVLAKEDLKTPLSDNDEVREKQQEELRGKFHEKLLDTLILGKIVRSARATRKNI